MAKVQKNDYNMNRCSCPKCPTYNDCSKDKKELLFCAVPLSERKCDYEVNGCICGMCLVHEENKLQSGYYCIYGSADEVDGKKEM